MLVDILRHLPPRSLAASRCVCTTWRATVDHHRLLRADLLPLSLDAIIYDKVEIDAPILFSRRSTSRYITSRLDYLEEDPAYGEYAGEMKDHCNGLILIQNDVVVNPATRQWAPLPPLPCACPRPRMATTSCGRCHNNRYLVYDPTMSPHYEVFFIPRVPGDVPADSDTACTTEWPPSQYVMHVFSSRTKCWKQRSFARDGDAPGTIQDVVSCRKSDMDLYYAAYWHGSLYVPCRQTQGGFILRINLSDDKYEAIKLPRGCRQFRLGKSKKGVYCVLYIDGRCKFQVWFLDESCGLIVWVFKTEINLEPAWRRYCWSYGGGRGPWILQTSEEAELLLKSDLTLVQEYNQAVEKDGFEWHSDDENAVGIVTDGSEKCNSYFDTLVLGCLGFHPYKEIVFFHEDDCGTVAYHLNSSKVRYLGRMEHHYSEIEISFPYAPCWTRDLPGGN